VEAYGAIPDWPEGAGDVRHPARAPINDTLRDWVEQHAPAAEVARQAAEREHIGMTLSDAVSLEMGRAAAARQGRPLPTGFQKPSEHPMILDVLLPQLGAARAMARLLTAEAILAAQRGDGELAARNIAAVARLGQHARDYPLMICDRVSFDLLEWAWQTLARLIEQDADLFSEQQLADLRIAFASFGAGEPIRVRLEWERNAYLDLVQRTYSDDGRGNGRMTRQGRRLIAQLQGSTRSLTGAGARTSALAEWNVYGYADRNAAVEAYDQLRAAVAADFSRPPWDRNPPIYAPMRDELSERAGRNLLLRFVTGGVRRIANDADDATLHRDAADLLLAMAQYRLEHSAWPPSLDVLVPDDLHALPPDPADGHPLRYTLRDGRPLLYSVGPDRTDDGGAGDDIAVWPLPADN
jgi:hypothetical protein